MQEVTLSLSEKGREDNSGYTDKSKAETPTTLKPARIELDSLLKQRGKSNHMRAWLRLWAFNLRKKKQLMDFCFTPALNQADFIKHWNPIIPKDTNRHACRFGKEETRLQQAKRQRGVMPDCDETPLPWEWLGHTAQSDTGVASGNCLQRGLVRRLPWWRDDMEWDEADIQTDEKDDYRHAIGIKPFPYCTQIQSDTQYTLTYSSSLQSTMP